ncbi:hypothetical protein [Afifella sp. IM 167]|uniref:hypothetical protein n=1 Tax=Afifella sp. IM 167 TaxID=2033586 RepID=UPI001CD02512|nr:hypothetical protein [Afifella sp. IM 167]
MKTLAGLSDGSRLVAIAQKGIMQDDDPSSPLHMSSQDCAGTVLVPKTGGEPFGAGSCTASDRDGDIWWLWWTSKGGTGGQWGAIAGTGKYEGLSGGGEVAYTLNLSDRTAIRYTGSLNLK